MCSGVLQGVRPRISAQVALYDANVSTRLRHVTLRQGRVMYRAATTDGRGLAVIRVSGSAREWACPMSGYDDGWTGLSCYTGEW